MRNVGAEAKQLAVALSAVRRESVCCSHTTPLYAAQVLYPPCTLLKVMEKPRPAAAPATAPADAPAADSTSRQRARAKTFDQSRFHAKDEAEGDKKFRAISVLPTFL